MTTEPNTMTEPTKPTDRIEQAAGSAAQLAASPEQAPRAPASAGSHRIVLEDLNAFYGDNHAVKDVNLAFEPNRVTAIIGPSGCGKSTMVRCVNRMHEEIPGARSEGRVMLDGLDLQASGIDVVAVRRAVGMVFQKPNPFPTMSIHDNVAAGLRFTGAPKHEISDRVESALRGAGLWAEVSDRLSKPGASLSGGQQQRLCIARALAVDPSVLLLDEPCSALDPVATLKIEELVSELKDRVTVAIVTHNMQQAGRVADTTAFMLERRPGRGRAHRQDLHPARRRTNRAVRDREVRLMATVRTRAEFRDELSRLEERGLDGLNLVTVALDRAMEAVQQQDIELAELVIADDDVIDGRYLEIHQSILTLLATQAPVASDLRLIAAILHVMKNIERMGDQCVNIAKMIPLAGHHPPAHEEMLKNIETMGKQVRTLITQAHRAFTERDVDMARDLVRRDDVVDNLNKETFRLALEIGDDADRREWAMTMLLVSRAIERIGDNAVDVGEQVAFLVTGLFREFEDASHPGESVPEPSSA